MLRLCLVCLSFFQASALKSISWRYSSSIGQRSNTSSKWPWSTDASDSDGLASLASIDELVTAREKVFPSGAPIMNGIDLMRAQVCAEMYRKHATEFLAFKECEKFMLKFCNPGDDKVMNGGEGEHSTGEGICKMFYSRKEKLDETEGKENGGGVGSYDRRIGKTLGHRIPAHAHWQGSPDAAWEKCERLGSECAGFTCESNGKSCSLRGPGNLRTSSNGEISYIKPGADVSEHDSEDDHYTKHEGQLNVGGSSSYKRYTGKMLENGVAGESGTDATGDIAAAEARCDEIGAACAGFTCDKDGNNCVLKGPGEMKDAENGEMSFMKPNRQGAGDNWHMDAKAALPEQGFQGKDVVHSDQQTLTKDWQKEFGPKGPGGSRESAGCDGPNAPSYWCKHRHRLQPSALRSTAAPAHATFDLFVLLMTTQVAVQVVL